MTLRLRFGVTGVIVVLLLIALGLIIPRVVTTSQITQVDQQLTEALPRALVLVKGTGASGPPFAGKSATPLPNVTERFSNIYIAVITSKGRQVFAAVASGTAAPKL